MIYVNFIKMDISHTDKDPFLASNYNNNMLYAKMEAFPKYRIFTNGDVYSETYKKFLKPNLNHYGYYRIVFCKEGKRTSIGVHRLLAMCFIPCNKNFSDMQVDHININKTDNRLSNLRWLDRSGQQLNKNYKETNTGYPFITEHKCNSTKSGFTFHCRIRRNGEYILATKRVKLEDALELVRLCIKENRFILDGLPRETVDKINEMYKLDKPR